MFQTISISWRAAWNTLLTLSSAISVEERREIDAGRQRIDDDRLVRARHLRDAEQRVIGRFPQKLGIDGDERMPRHARADLGKFRGGADQIH